MSRPSTHSHRDDRGAAAVEFALVLPILLVLVLGIVQFGITFSQWLEMEHAAREGARWGSIGYAVPDIRAKVRASAPGLNPPLTDEQIAITPADPLNASGEPITVAITYDTMVLPLIGPLIGQAGPTMRLNAAAVQRIE